MCVCVCEYDIIYLTDLGFSKFNQAYKEKRKFAYSALRNLGMRMGPGSMEENIREEGRQLCLKVFLRTFSL